MAVSRIDEAGLNVTQYGNRNLIINGAATVAQRGTSATTPSGANYSTVDRFKPNLTRLDELVLTESQDTDAPDGFSNSFKISVGTAESAIGADEYGFLTYIIEAQDLQQLNYGSASAKKITLSFWVKSSVTGTYGTTFYQQDAARVITSTYTINTASTWEYKTITIDGDPSGTINNDNGGGLQIWFPWGAGSDYTSVDSTSWTSYADNKSMYGHAANTLLTTASATWQITGVQLEVGDTATGFEHRSYGDELARCQRYYYQLAGDAQMVGHGFYYGTSEFDAQIYFPVTMRTTPTFTSSNNTNDFRINNNNDDFNTWSGSQYFDGIKMNLYVTSGVSGTDGKAGYAALRNASTSKIQFDAEL